MAENQHTSDQEAAPPLWNEHPSERALPIYQGWSAVPAGLFARGWLEREGLFLPAGVLPVAQVYARNPDERQGPYVYTELYRREDAVKRQAGQDESDGPVFGQPPIVGRLRLLRRLRTWLLRR